MTTSIIPVFIPHLGCPHQCSFCNQKRISSTIDTILPESLEVLADSYLQSGGNQHFALAFYGGSFTALPAREQERYLQAAASLLQKKKITGIHLSTRPDAISEAGLALLQSYQVSVIELGVQSMDPLVLEQSRRGHSAEEVTKAAGLIRAGGFRLGLQIMPGLPGDSREKFLSTVRAVLAMKPDFIRIYPTLVIRDTPLAESWSLGDYQPVSLEEMVDWVADAFRLSCAEGVPVIRMGLQATDTLASGLDLVAGPYHPAFGELVLGEIYYRMILETIHKLSGSETLWEITCNEKDLSKVLGQKKINQKRLEEKGIRFFCRIVPDQPPGRVMVSDNEKKWELDLKEYCRRSGVCQ